MGKIIYAFIIAALLWIYQPGAAQEMVKAPAFSGSNISGKGLVSLKQYAGKVVLINFWATWCPPCRLEIPDLIKLENIYSNRFTVIGISVDQGGIETVSNFCRKYGINYPVIMSRPSIIEEYGGISAIPTSFIVTTNGRIVKSIIGYRNLSQYEEEIAPYLSTRPPVKDKNSY